MIPATTPVRRFGIGPGTGCPGAGHGLAWSGHGAGSPPEGGDSGGDSGGEADAHPGGEPSDVPNWGTGGCSGAQWAR